MEKNFNINKSGYSIQCKMYFNDIKTIKRVVLYGHGFGGHKDNKSAEKFADHILKKYKDIATITFNAPCHGDDVRKKLILSECLTYIKLVTEYIEDRFSPQAIYGYATSFGGYLFLKYLSESPNPFKKIVLRCPAVNMYGILTDRLIAPDDLHQLSCGKPVLIGFDRKIKITQSFLDDLKENDISTVDYSGLSDSILIMHGTDDNIVPFDDVKKFAENNGIAFVPVEGADHRFKDPLKMDMAIKIIVDFFEF